RLTNLTASLSMRPAPTWQFSVAPVYIGEQANRQFVNTFPGGRLDTYGNRYIFGAIERKTLSIGVRVNHTFKPDLTLDVYMEPFAASGRYTQFGELDRPGASDLRIYGAGDITQTRLADGSYRMTDGTTVFSLPNLDFNVKSLRSNVVLRWERRPGSMVYIVWQQNRSETLSRDP